MNCRDSSLSIARLEPIRFGGLFRIPGVHVPERLAFALATLADTANAPRPIAGCDNGHLIVAGRTCWQPETFSADLKTITCRLVEDCDTANR